jgi:hypothetical protein
MKKRKAQVKPLFLYQVGTVEDPELKKITKAGYIPVAIQSLDCAKVIEPLPVLCSDAVAKAAFETIAEESGPFGARDRFALKVAKALSK